MTELARWLSTQAASLRQLKSIRVDLRRSLRMHLPLALGAALAALGAGIVFLYAFFPGTIAVFDSTSFIVRTTTLLLASAAFGVVAAVTARNLDQRVYVGADVEDVLGVPAMEELPDFGEVPEECSEVDLLRLANGIAHTCTKGSVRRCVFTGAGPGTGVTTLAVRVKESLKTLERPAMLVDATGAAEAEPADRGAARRLSSHRAADESGSRCDELILTDTAPVTASPDTEYLARFADCVVVVAESGVTTRAQLRGAAECLRQLNVSKVRFVVNRVRQRQPGQGLREPLSVPGVAPGQFAEALRRALAEPPNRAAKEPTLRPNTRKLAFGVRPAEKPATALAIVKHAPESPAWQLPGVPSWLSDALVQLEAEAQPATPATEVEAHERTRETDSWGSLAGCDPFEPVRTQPEPFETGSRGDALHLDDAQDVLFAMDDRSAQDTRGCTPAPPFVAGSSHEEKPSLLSSLRGKVPVTGLKGMGQARHDEAGAPPQASESEFGAAMPAPFGDEPARLDGLRGLVTPEFLKELSRPGPPMPEAGVAGEPLQGPTAYFFATDREIAETAPGLGPAEPPTGVSVAGPELIGPPAQAATVTEKTARKPKASRSKFAASARRKRPANDEVQTLPSKRGQYRRKSRDQGNKAARQQGNRGAGGAT